MGFMDGFSRFGFRQGHPGMGFINSKTAAAGKLLAISAIPIVGGPIALSKLHKLKGSGKAGRNAKFANAWNGAKRQVLAGIERIAPQIDQVAKAVRKYKAAIQQIQKLAEGTESPDVADGVAMVQELYGQLDSANDVLSQGSEDINYKIEAILDAEETGDILAGQPANVYLEELKAMTPEVEAGVRQALLVVKQLDKAIRIVQDAAKKDSEMRKFEAEAQARAAAILKREMEDEERKRKIAEERERREAELEALREQRNARALATPSRGFQQPERPIMDAVPDADQVYAGRPAEKGLIASLFGWLFG